MKVAVFSTKEHDKRFLDEHNQKFNLSLKYFETKLNLETVALTKGFEAVCAFVNDDLSKEVVDQLVENGVKLVALRCAGYNNVDLKAADNRLTIVRVPAYSPYAVAEYTVGLMLSLNRKIPLAVNKTKFLNFTLNGLLGFDMNGKTVGVIGTGKIAKVLIKILNGFGMRVIAYSPFEEPEAAKELGFEYVPLKDLYQQSDIITLHCPLNEETFHLINEKSLSLMKDGVMIINTGRGGLIKTDDLLNALKNKKVGSAGLDVYEEEEHYFFDDFSSEVITDDDLSRLLSFNNVLITSHQGFFTEEALHNIAQTTLKNIDSFIHTGELVNQVKI